MVAPVRWSTTASTLSERMDGRLNDRKEGERGEGQMEYVLMMLLSVVMILLPLIPVIYLLKRVGMSLAWALLLLFPFFGFVVVVWVIAFSRWKPKLETVF